MASTRLDLMLQIAATLKAQATSALSMSLTVRERALHLYTTQAYTLVEMYDLRVQIAGAVNSETSSEHARGFFSQFEERRQSVVNMPRMDNDDAATWRAASLNAVSCINLFLSDGAVRDALEFDLDAESQCRALYELSGQIVRASDTFWRRVDEYEKVRLDCTTTGVFVHNDGDAVDVAYRGFMEHFVCSIGDAMSCI